MIQGANLLVLLVAKATISEADFAFVLTNLAFAGIIGSVATMRLEVLVFQAQGITTYSAALLPSIAIGTVIVASYLANAIFAQIGAASLELSASAIPMIIGLGLSAILAFLFVQDKQLNALLAMRVVQAGMLALLVVALFARIGNLGGEKVLLFIGIGYAAPAFVGLIYVLIQVAPKRAADQPMFAPSYAMVKRSGLLTASTGVNSVYVNLPILAAAATQSAGFVADFGMIMRMFTAPITLIFQVFGRLFLAESIRWSLAKDKAMSALSRLVSKTMARSVVAYACIAPILLGVLFLFRTELDITNLAIAPFLFMAALGQCAINPVSQVRISLNDETAFLFFDFLRLVVLAVGLFVLASAIAFEIAFGLTALSLYTAYIFFIRFRIARQSRL